MARRQGPGPLEAASGPAIVFHYALWHFWQPTTAWVVSVVIFWIVGFPVGWRIEPYFVSRQRRYVASPIRQAGDRITMGIAGGGALGLLGGLIASAISR